MSSGAGVSSGAGLGAGSGAGLGAGLGAHGAMGGVELSVAERRAMMAATAARTERGNRPIHVVALACVLLVVAAGALLLAWGRLGTARTQLSGAAAQRERFIELGTRWREVAARAGGEQGPKASETATNLGSRIVAQGVKAGMVNPPGLPTTSDDRARPGATSKRVVTSFANVKDPDLSALLRWIDLSIAEVPGLELYTLTLRVENDQWNLGSVKFSRWERVGP
ncbi:MAG: hypothetical protein JNL50_03700 [Phycisphaerae bacterium]|nr:hypothetical protein [Phycisphaerae bacterium]